MEKMKEAPVPEGEEPKSAIEIVEQVLKTEVKQSTFLRNVGSSHLGTTPAKQQLKLLLMFVTLSRSWRGPSFKLNWCKKN